MQKISDLSPKRKDQAERRQYTRFKPVAGAIAAIVSDFDRIGNIVDMSQGGLAYITYPHVRAGSAPKQSIFFIKILNCF